MNGKIRVVLATLLVGAVSVQANQAAYEEATKILFGQFMPNDIRPATVAAAVLGVAGGTALSTYKDVIADNEVAGPVLQRVCLGQVKPADVLDGLGVAVGVQGLTGLWQNGPSHRLAYWQSFGLLVAKEQMQHPGVVGEHEIRNAAVGALAVMQGVPFLRDVLPGMLAGLRG